MQKKLFFAMETGLLFPQRHVGQWWPPDVKRDLASKGEYGELLELCMLLEWKDGETFRHHPISIGQYARQEWGNTLAIQKVLNYFWDFVRRLDPSTDLLIGYNIRREALPFLCKQTAIYGGPPPPHNLCFTDKQPRFVFDVLEVWSHGSDEDISLPQLANFLSIGGREVKELLSKKDFDLADVTRHKEITERCFLKIDLIRSIYYRLTFQVEPPNK